MVSRTNFLLNNFHFEGDMQARIFSQMNVYSCILFIIIMPAFSDWAHSQPSVLSVTPSCNALNVVPITTLSFTLNVDINFSTVTNNTVRINGTLSGLHPSAFSYDVAAHTVTVTPNTQFKVGETVGTTITRGVKNTAGDSLAKSYSWSFLVKTNASSGLYQQASSVGVGNTPWYIVAADFDRDGAIDLAAVNNYSNSVSILKNCGTGVFTNTSTVKVGSYPGSITTSDLDGDGDMDLAVTNSESNTVSILMNDGQGKFTQTSAPTVEGAPWNVAAADLDGDGTIDLAVTSYSGTISILKNNGSGSFTLASTVTVGSSPYAVTAADLDNDGASDLAVTNYGSNTVSILVNNGRGIFTNTSTVNVGNGPCAIAAKDFDGDGAIDLAVANLDANTISILKNNGQGMFTLASTVNTGNSPASVIAVDADGNGTADLAVVNAGSGTVSILKNNGSGSFAPVSSVSSGVGSSPRIVTAADLDGDGRIDLAVVNLNLNSISILKSRPPNAAIDVSSSLLAFGSVSAGKSKSAYLKIYNSGTDSSLVIGSIVSSNPVFTVDRTSLTIPPSEYDSVQVVFAPVQSNHVFNDSLLLTTNDLRNPKVKISLNGSTSFDQPRQAVVLATVGGPIYAGISILGDDVMYVVASGDAVYRMNTSGTIAYMLQVGGDVRSSSSIAYDTTVYIASSDRNLYAFSKNGNSVWSPMPTGGVLTATAVIDSIANRLYIGVSNHNFIAVNRSTGSVAWNYFADDQIKQSAVVTADRKLVFVSNKGTLYGFNLNALASPAAPAWQIALPDTAPGPLAIDVQGNVYVGTSAGNLLKILLPADLPASILWRTSLGSAITSSPVIDANGMIYAGSINSKLFAVNPQTGSIKWEFATKGPIRSTPTISNIGNIYVANDSGEVYSLDTNKNVLWRYQTVGAISAPLLHYKSHLYAGTQGHQIIRLYGKEDSAGITTLIKSSVLAQNSAQPMWSTFQGNSQRTGMASVLGATGIRNDDHQIPHEFVLRQNYPNPFNPTTTIRYELPRDCKVSIKVFNLLGGQLLVPVDNVQQAGTHQVTIDARSLPSGIYFYQVTAGPVVQTKKMILMR